MDSSPGVALYASLVFIKERSSVLAHQRFLKDVHVTITVFTLLYSREANWEANFQP